MECSIQLGCRRIVQLNLQQMWWNAFITKIYNIYGSLQCFMVYSL
jgi:hypothetical protein